MKRGNMSNRWANKVALITGAASGMGASHARMFVSEGACVMIADISDAAGNALADELGENARYTHLNVTDPNDWAVAVEATLTAFGTLNISLARPRQLCAPRINSDSDDDGPRWRRAHRL
ncbi:SDR family NAD(P)-dependent oxidoreductase [Pseudarthrobacter sp. NPDC058329]|uniref:SDR family NAD(P)-dependent oxidoreductase n=1 Tax=Pseudarthrobacter sp. NPDC058329 TaxID=3346448 RepID=UPI0036DC3684